MDNLVRDFGIESVVDLLVLCVNYRIIRFVRIHIDIWLILHLKQRVRLGVFRMFQSSLKVRFRLFSNVVHVRNILHLYIDVLFHTRESLVEPDGNDLLLSIAEKEK